jgi:hypothetical protein
VAARRLASLAKHSGHNGGLQVRPLHEATVLVVGLEVEEAVHRGYAEVGSEDVVASCA